MDRKQALALCGMDETAHALLGLYCAEQGSEQRLAAWFAETEFEALRPEVSCIAAAISAAQNYCDAPKELLPRLRGIMKYVHTLNSGMTAGLLSLGTQCKQAEIPLMLLGGTAIHFSVENPPRRHLWRMEVGVSEEKFPRVVELAKHIGFAVEQTPYSATARSGNTQCIFLRSGMDSTQGARSLTIGEVPFLIPCHAELLVGLAQAGFETLLNSRAPLLPWFTDMHCLVKGAPIWEDVARIAKKRGVATQVRLMLELYCMLTTNAAMEAALSFFATEAQSARMAQHLLQYRACKPNTLKHRRLREQIRTETSPLAALWQIAKRKLTRSK